jgi:hypothetical protein
MGHEPTHRGKSDALSAADVKNTSSADARRHVLPKDLPNAVKHLTDEELDRLLAATLAEAKQRGRQITSTYEPSPSRKLETTVSLTRGQLNAVRAAFKAGITPARIARQFGLSPTQVRRALTTEASKEGSID